MGTGSQSPNLGVEVSDGAEEGRRREGGAELLDEGWWAGGGEWGGERRWRGGLGMCF